jgi:NAD(P)-dependent dehydrogenase (short-subunit alcohol dehydrogenase family)
MGKLDGKVALVTGGARGMGASHVQTFLDEGAKVVFGDIREEEGRALGDKLGDGCRFVPHDVTSEDAWIAIVEHTTSTFGRLDVLVNNAGITGGMPQTPTAVDPATVLQVVDTNVVGVIRVTNAMLPLLRRSPSPRVVNMSSSVGSLTLQTTPDAFVGPVSAAYSPSKTFLNAVTVQYAKELADTNVLINAGCPGYCSTDLNGFRGTRTPEQGAQIAIQLATLPDGGPTGRFFDDAGPVAW